MSQASDLDNEVMRALIEQVSKAVPEGGNEYEVLTLITRPMWDMWCRAVEFPVGWPPIWPIRTVYGSITILIESDRAQAGSKSLR